MSSFITFVCSEGLKKNKKKNRTKKKSKFKKQGKGKSIPVPTNKKESKGEEKKESDGILAVKYYTYEELQQNKFKEAEENDEVINLVDYVNDNETIRTEFWNNYGTTYAALSFFDTALLPFYRDYTFNTLPEYVNVEVLMLTIYLRNIFQIAKRVDWEIQRKKEIEYIFSRIVETVRDNQEVLMENEAIYQAIYQDVLMENQAMSIDDISKQSIDDISKQYYTNDGMLHGVFNEIWDNMSNNKNPMVVNIPWNIYSKIEVFNEIKNDSRFETVFVMIDAAFKIVAFKLGENDDEWKLIWDKFWSNTLSSLVFKFESNYLNNVVLNVLQDRVYDWINRYTKSIATIDVNDVGHTKISDNIKDDLREEYTNEIHTNIKDYYFSYSRLIEIEDKFKGLYNDVYEEKKKQRKEKEKQFCSVMLHNAKTINF
jgi:hypothetical protein